MRLLPPRGIKDPIVCPCRFPCLCIPCPVLACPPPRISVFRALCFPIPFLRISARSNATSANLVGPIDALSTLDQLQRLDLSSNSEVKALPQSFTKLKKLSHLNVNGCSIKGRIPAFLGQLTALTYLSIGDNSFEGALPSSLGSLVNLVFLNIGGTGEDGVGGALPASFANLTKLKELYLHNNRFSGPLPDFIGSFTKLEQLMVSKNRWEGAIPKTFSKLKKLRLLGLMETSLEGEIPTFLGALEHLTYLSLSDTRLYGEVPKALSGLAKLRELYLQNALFYGPISGLSTLKQLTLIDLSSNYFSGPIPAFLQRVKKVNAADNYFSGSASSLPCSDDFSLGGNCLVSVSPKCGESAAQKSAAECNKFCGTATATGACSGKGVCVMDVDQSLGSQAFVPACKCQAGFWASHKKQRRTTLEAPQKAPQKPGGVLGLAQEAALHQEKLLNGCY
ncbi:unnamed protein product [Closterium sp. Naga37s-1]|nr:unnamed protein product [Closterium sp. Naga37s-1]